MHEITQVDFCVQVPPCPPPLPVHSPSRLAVPRVAPRWGARATCAGVRASSRSPSMPRYANPSMLFAVSRRHRRSVRVWREEQYKKLPPWSVIQSARALAPPSASVPTTLRLARGVSIPCHLPDSTTTQQKAETNMFIFVYPFFNLFQSCT